MSVLDEVTTKVKSVLGEKVPGSAGLLSYLTEYLNRPEVGGVQGLVQKFEKAGLGPQIQSWLGAGKKLPVNPDEVTRALGTADISEIATRAGMAPAQVSQQLATLLPEAVSKLVRAGNTPHSFEGIVGAVKEKIGI